MSNLKKLMGNADDEILSELIGKCEKAMVGPLKKKEVAIEIEPEEESQEPSEEESEGSQEDGESLSEEDLQKLVEMYKSLKG